MADLNAFRVIGDSLTPYTYIGGLGRYFGRIFPDVTLEERHDDEMAITDHPVETGAAISDHCFVLPSRLELRIGFSDSTGQAEGYSRIQYSEILALQRERQPFSVSTGKRQYTNMLIQGIQVITDPDSENSLKAIIRIREVQRVSTQQASSSGDSGSTTDPSKTDPGSSDAKTTAPYSSLGDKVPTPVSGGHLPDVLSPSGPSGTGLDAGSALTTGNLA
jgi:hypothetical protein